MKLEIELYTDEKKVINLNYNYYITSTIYKLIEDYNMSYSKYLHDEGYKLGNKKFKLFVYSRLIPDKFNLQGPNMTIAAGRTRLYINSPIKEFINSLGNSLVKKGEVRIGKEMFQVKNIYLKDNYNFDYKTEFKTLSPIVITTKEEIDGEIKPRTVYITEDKFVENIKNNLLKKYFLVNGKLPDDMNINISFDERYIEKNKRGNLIDFKGIKIKGFICPFTMKCASDLKRVAIDCGIGENNSIGMGYIEPK